MNRALTLIPALLLLACGGRPEPAPARQTYDEAIIAALDGDAITWREKLIALAAAHPDTPHGRAAIAQLGGSGALAALSVFSSVAAAGFADYLDRAAEAPSIDPYEMETRPEGDPIPTDGVPAAPETL
ncbi:MAG: hypothetical protein R3F65_28315 [bacterium]